MTKDAHSRTHGLSDWDGNPVLAAMASERRRMLNSSTAVLDKAGELSPAQVVYALPRYGASTLPRTRERLEAYRSVMGHFRPGPEELVCPGVPHLALPEMTQPLYLAELDDQSLAWLEDLARLAAVEAIKTRRCRVKDEHDQVRPGLTGVQLEASQQVRPETKPPVCGGDGELVDHEQPSADGLRQLSVTSGAPMQDIFGIVGAEGATYGAIVLQCHQNDAGDLELLVDAGVRNPPPGFLREVLCEEGAGSLAVEIICENSFLECHPIRAVVRFTDSAQAGGRPPTTTTTQRDDDRSAGR